MFKRWAVFLFAVGVSAGAFAVSDEYAECVTACDQAFIECVNRGVGTAACSRERMWCRDECEGL